MEFLRRKEKKKEAGLLVENLVEPFETVSVDSLSKYKDVYVVHWPLGCLSNVPGPAPWWV